MMFTHLDVFMCNFCKRLFEIFEFQNRQMSRMDEPLHGVQPEVEIKED